MNNKVSTYLYNEAQKYIPGGVNSPVRAFSSVGMKPLFIKSGNGSHVIDADGNEYIDYVASYGPLILGHNYKNVREAILNSVNNGTGFGSSTENEVALCKLITSASDFCHMVRLVNSGTEATMSAIRLARTYTGRNKIIKFEGCYHGHSDGLLIKAGSGALTHNVPSSPGVPAEYSYNTLIAKFNDIESVDNLFKLHKDSIAAVIIEPVAGNMGVVKPKNNFLSDLYNLAHKKGALFIADEVMTGFRLSFGGACSIYNIKPDIVTYGKIIGGGLPVGAYGGKREIMELVSPRGPMYQAGTLSGNPVTAAAGIAALSELKNNPEIYKNIEVVSKCLEDGIKNILKNKCLPYIVERCGSMITLFINDCEITNFEDVLKCDTVKFANVFKVLIEHGVFIPPSQFETMFVSAAHTIKDIEDTLNVIDIALS